MSSFRVTDRSIAMNVLAGLQGNLSRIGDSQQQLSSGKLIARPSDSPTGTVSAMQYRGDLRRLEQYVRNADDGLGWLGTVDHTLTSTLEQVRKARDLTLQGMSAGVADAPNAREAIAVEIENLRDSLIGLANTSYLDRPVFGGTTSGAVAYDADGTYVGDSGTVSRTVGEGAVVQVNASAAAVFGADMSASDPTELNSTQLFTVLDNIAKHLRGEAPTTADDDPTTLDDNLGRLDTAMNRVISQLADVGSRYSRIDQMRKIAESRSIDLTMQLSGVEDIDLPKTIMDLQLRQAAYQAALGAAARIVQPSLVDFLR